MSDKDRCEMCGKEMTWLDTTYVIPGVNAALPPKDICADCTKQIYEYMHEEARGRHAKEK